MTTYRSTTVEVEAMQWCGCNLPGCAAERAEEIVAWVKANGGEAEYVDVTEEGYGARFGIAIRTINGWAYASPGHYVVMGDATFDATKRHGSMECGYHRLRDFYPCDRKTFKRRWVTA